MSIENSDTRLPQKPISWLKKFGFVADQQAANQTNRIPLTVFAFR